LAGSARIASDFRENLAERKTMNDDVPTINPQGMALIIRASSLVRHSSFVIRHFPIRHSNHAR